MVTLRNLYAVLSLVPMPISMIIIPKSVRWVLLNIILLSCLCLAEQLVGITLSIVCLADVLNFLVVALQRYLYALLPKLPQAMSVSWKFYLACVHEHNDLCTWLVSMNTMTNVLGLCPWTQWPMFFVGHPEFTRYFMTWIGQISCKIVLNLYNNEKSLWTWRDKIFGKSDKRNGSIKI